MVHYIKSEYHIFSFSKFNKPIVKVNEEDEIVFKTLDCFSNQIKSDDFKLESIDWNRVNPATGPVYVRNALPGDVLEVIIEDIKIENKGVIATGKNIGILGDEFDKLYFKVVEIKDGKIEFDENIKISVEPMIGVIGVAPEEGEINCGTPGRHGGNLDTKLIKKGARVFLPVFVEGGLLALGDLHAVMGDGEVCGTGVEVEGKVTVKVRIRKDLKLNTPMVIYNDKVSLLYSDVDLNRAVEKSIKEMIKTIQSKKEVSSEKLLMLFSLIGNVEISQIVDPLVTARFSIPYNLLKKLIEYSL